MQRASPPARPRGCSCLAKCRNRLDACRLLLCARRRRICRRHRIRHGPAAASLALIPRREAVAKRSHGKPRHATRPTSRLASRRRDIGAMGWGSAPLLFSFSQQPIDVARRAHGVRPPCCLLSGACWRGAGRGLGRPLAGACASCTSRTSSADCGRHQQRGASAETLISCLCCPGPLELMVPASGLRLASAGPACPVPPWPVPPYPGLAWPALPCRGFPPAGRRGHLQMTCPSRAPAAARCPTHGTVAL